MRDPARIDPTIEKLRRAWKQAPDLRLGQLLAYLMGSERQDTFYVEDDKWNRLLDAHLADANYDPE